MKPLVTIIVPYYNQPQMLSHQLFGWSAYSDDLLSNFEFIVVDDGSKTRASESAMLGLKKLPLRLFRIDEDIPWNRGEARNIGWKEARTDWIFQMDIDHGLSVKSAAELIEWFTDLSKCPPDTADWYRFRRFRVGAADHTRNKDALPREATHGEIKPHIDSYLCTRARYHNAGGYNLAFSGCLGGGSPFLHQMEKLSVPMLAPPEISLDVYTSSVCADSSAELDRDTSEYKRRRVELERAGKIKGTCEIKHEYTRVI